MRPPLLALVPPVNFSCFDKARGSLPAQPEACPFDGTRRNNPGVVGEATLQPGKRASFGTKPPVPSDDPYKHLGRRPPAFRPNFTLSILYLVVFFLLFAFALILPSMLEVLAEVPAGPEQEQVAYEVARQVARPRLLLAIALSIATVTIGSYYKVLPGLKR